MTRCVAGTAVVMEEERLVCCRRDGAAADEDERPPRRELLTLSRRVMAARFPKKAWLLTFCWRFDGVLERRKRKIIMVESKDGMDGAMAMGYCPCCCSCCCRSDMDVTATPIISSKETSPNTASW